MLFQLSKVKLTLNPRTLEPGGSDPARGAIFKNNIFPLNYISGNTYVILESVLTLTGVYVMSFSNVQIFHKKTKRDKKGTADPVRRILHQYSIISYVISDPVRPNMEIKYIVSP